MGGAGRSSLGVGGARGAECACASGSAIDICYVAVGSSTSSAVGCGQDGVDALTKL